MIHQIRKILHKPAIISRPPYLNLPFSLLDLLLQRLVATIGLPPLSHSIPPVSSIAAHEYEHERLQTYFHTFFLPTATSLGLGTTLTSSFPGINIEPSLHPTSAPPPMIP